MKIIGNSESCAVKNKDNKAMVDSILRPRCALPLSAFPCRQCIFSGEENPFPAIGDASYRKHVGGGVKDRATATGNMHKKLVKIVRVVPEIYALSMGKKTPSQRHAMRPIVNMSDEDRAMDTGNIHKKIARVVLEISSRTDRQTHRSTDILITILRNAERQTNRRPLR